MTSKFWIMVGLIVGTTTGSYVPALWGDASWLSLSSIFFTLVGGIIGIWAGFKVWKLIGE